MVSLLIYQNRDKSGMPSRIWYSSELTLIKMDGTKLIMQIAQNKGKNQEEAQKAFALFCSYYEKDALKMAKVICQRYQKPEKYAFDIVQCAFEKVWLYHSFDREKANIKNTDRAILQWISKILYHELMLFSEKGNCSHPEAEDLPLITSTEAFIEEYLDDEYLPEERFSAIKAVLDKAFSELSEQEITIYLTYKLYLKVGKTVPRNVLKKLRSRYKITQDGIKHCRLRVEQKLGRLAI